MTNFHRVWIVSGLLFGLGMSVVDVLIYDDNLLIICIFGSVFGSIAGFCFAGLGSFLSRSKNVSCLNGFFLVVLGFFLGIGSFLGLHKFPHGEWEQIISPPEKAVQFLDQSAFSFWDGSISVVSEDGNIFSYICDSENPCNWVEEEFPPSKPEENLWSCPSGYQGLYVTPLTLFKTVVDSYEVTICAAQISQINLILLGDGTIWVWKRFSPGMEIVFCFPVWLIFSSGSGITSYMAFPIRKKRLRLGNVVNS